MQKNIVLLVCLILITAMSSSWARKPAVEPVGTIVVEEYNAPKENVKGFNFNKESKGEAIKSKTTNSKIRTISSEKTETGSTAGGLLFLVIIAAVPFAFWFGIMMGVKTNNSEVSKNAKAEVDPEVEDHNDHDDMNFPKAS